MTAIRTILAVTMAALFWRLIERSYRRRATRVRSRPRKPVRPHDELRLTNL